jgi:hypothetical protein
LSPRDSNGGDNDRRKAESDQRRHSGSHLFDPEEPQQNVARHSHAGHEYGQEHWAQSDQRDAPSKDGQKYGGTNNKTPERNVRGCEAVFLDEHIHNQCASAPEDARTTGGDECQACG